jgi:gliding motility-associated-like protein
MKKIKFNLITHSSCLRFFSLIFLFFFYTKLQAQYTVNRDAFSTSCRCYTLTRALDFQSGSVWNNTRIDLRQSFDFYFVVNLGCDDLGADGIAFVLQPISTNVGGSGGGMGFEGVRPSVGVTLDTYQNTNDNDPVFDHMAIQLNGDIVHTSPQNISSTVSISATNNNVEDCRDHVMRVVWNATTFRMEVFFDGQTRVSANYDLINQVFSGNPLVYWGFTGATGGSKNVQSFCTALVPKFYSDLSQRFCVNEPIRFIDSSITLGGIVKRYWDFDDGSPIDSVSIEPTHTYAQPGNYRIKYKVVGIDGCSATFEKPITIGAKPLAAIAANPLCTDRNIQLQDQSTVVNASIQNRFWKIESSGQTFTQSNPQISFSQAGNQLVLLHVVSSDGCASDTLRKDLYIHPTPTISASVNDICLDDTLTLEARETTTDSTVIANWSWKFSDGSSYSGNGIRHVFNNAGPASISVFALSSQGCFSDTLDLNLQVYHTQVYAGADTFALANQPVQLNATGALQYNWSPSTGLSSTIIPNPITRLNSTQTYIVRGSTPIGCETVDSITVYIVENRDILLPNAFSPNGNGLNDIFRLPASVVKLNRFSVYNRFGELIFNTQDKARGWDGYYKGKLQSPGSYVWVLDCFNLLGQRKILKGTVMLFP